MRHRPTWIVLVLIYFAVGLAHAGELGKDGFADSDGVKIHYVTMGKGPLVVLIHGFPDYWYTWRKQMPALAKHFQVVAIDQRGYNKSDQPTGVENYTMDKLVGDVVCVVDHTMAFFSGKQASFLPVSVKVSVKADHTTSATSSSPAIA